MRHRISHKHFNRDSNHRKALLKNLVRGLVLNGEITTTKEKAKEAKRVSDKLIHKALVDSLTVRRTLHTYFGRRDVVNTLVDRIAPAMKDRVSGFTRIIDVGSRKGDNASMVRLELVTKPSVVGTLKNPGEKKVFAKSAKTAKVTETKVAKEVKAPKASKAVAKKAPVATKVKKTATSKKESSAS